LRAFSNLTIFDSVGLEATADYGVRNLDIVFHVRVSVAAGGGSGRRGLDRFVGQPDPVPVEEGGDAVLGVRNLNTSGIMRFLHAHARQGGGGGSIPELLMRVR